MDTAVKRINTHALVLMGVLSACSIILSRFLGFYLNETLRVSFGSVPILLAGLWLGPLAGGLVGAVSDILGATVFSGLGLYPPITIGPILVGVAAGVMARVCLGNAASFLRVAVVVFVAKLIGSLIWTSYALSLMTGAPYWAVLTGRIPFCLVMDLMEILLVYLLHKRLGGRLGLGVSIQGPTSASPGMDAESKKVCSGATEDAVAPGLNRENGKTRSGEVRH